MNHSLNHLSIHNCRTSAITLDKISEGSIRRVDGDVGTLLRPLFFAEDLDKIQIAFVLRNAINSDLTYEYQPEFDS